MQHEDNPFHKTVRIMHRVIIAVLTVLSYTSLDAGIAAANDTDTMISPDLTVRPVSILSGHVCNFTETLHLNETRLVTNRCSFVVYRKCRKAKKTCSKTKYRECTNTETEVVLKNVTIAVCCTGWSDNGNGSCSVPVCDPSCQSPQVCVEQQGGQNVCMNNRNGSNSNNSNNITLSENCSCAKVIVCGEEVQQTTCQCLDNSTWSPCSNASVFTSARDIYPIPGTDIMLAWWAWLIVAFVIVAVIAAIVLVVCRTMKNRPRSMTRDLSRFTESFRFRFKREGISNPVFDADNVRIPKSARTLPRTDNSTAMAAPVGVKHMNNNTAYDVPRSLANAHRRMSGSFDVSAADDHASTLRLNENHYVDHDPPFANSKQTVVCPESLEDHYETIPDPTSIYDVPNPKAPDLDTIYDVPRPASIDDDIIPVPVPSPQPARDAPNLGQSKHSKPRKKKKRSKPPIYGNVEPEATSPRTSSGISSEEGRSSSEVYVNVDGAAYVKKQPHRALEESDDTYDFAPKSSADIYVGHSPGSTLTGQNGLQSDSDSSSDGSNVYQAVDEEDDYDNLKVDVAIENPLFGLDNVPEDIYENDKEDKTSWRTVNIGNDHVYETLA